jgi:hypothetical protein
MRLESVQPLRQVIGFKTISAGVLTFGPEKFFVIHLNTKKPPAARRSGPARMSTKAPPVVVLL